MREVLIDIDRDATNEVRRDGEGAIVARFVENIPLYRIVDGAELSRVLSGRKVRGGFFTVQVEREGGGASWGSDLQDVLSFGLRWQRYGRLGKDLFLFEIEAINRDFYHMQSETPFDPNGSRWQTVSMPVTVCSAGLGCSVFDVSSATISKVYRVVVGRVLKDVERLKPLSRFDMAKWSAKHPVKAVSVGMIVKDRHYGGTVHGVDVEFGLDHKQVRNPYYQKWQATTRDGHVVLRGAKSLKQAVEVATHLLENGVPYETLSLLAVTRPKRGSSSR